MYNIFPKGNFQAATELTLQKKYMYPLRTYKDMESDPLSAITNSLSKLEENEGAAIQLVITRASESLRRKPRRVALEIQQGKHPYVAERGYAAKGLFGFFRFFGDFYNEIFRPRLKSKGELDRRRHIDLSGERTPLQLTPMQQELVKKLEEKSSKSFFKANLRIVTSARTQEAAQGHLRNILSSFMQFTYAPFNGFRAIARPALEIVRDYLFRLHHDHMLHRMVLNTEELTSVWHLPTRFIETPNIKWLRSKKAPPPVNAPAEGLLLGKNIYRGVETPIRITRDDRRRHVYIIGRTGTGKTELLKNMAVQDIKNGEGVCVVDPHGDLIDGILEHIPKERAEEVILFDPSDMERPPGLNMLEIKDPSQMDFAIQEMISVFYKLFPPEVIGPMFEHNMRNAMLTLMADKETPGTIAEIPRIFTDPEFQKYKLEKVQDPVVRLFWEKEMAKTSDFHKSEMLGYLISKVGRFVENQMMRNIIGQSHSAFDFRDVMDKGKILLVSLSKGKVGEVNAKLLGLIIVSKLQMAALSRADMPEGERRDFYLYVDEFQNFVTESFATILSEARKYRLNLIIAHQYLGQLATEKPGASQLDTRLRDAVFGNAGTMICFRIGVEDAQVMAKEFAPTFSEFDLINVERFNAYLKLMIRGTASKPFNLATLPPPPGGSREIASAIRTLSRLTYGRPREEVERDILERTRLAEAKTSPFSVERTR
jgi:hypothetical protein